MRQLVSLFVSTVLFAHQLRFSASTKVDDDQLPHIIFILADDVGYNDVGWAGDDYAGLTPTLDKLKKNGVELTNYYTQQLCTPARAALMTGRYPYTIGMQDSTIHFQSDWGVPVEYKFLPEYLAEVGYESHIVGKWHLGHAYEHYTPHARGFTSFYGFLNGLVHYRSHRTTDTPSYLDFMESWASSDTIYTDSLGQKAEKGWRCVTEKAGEFSTTLFTDRAIDIAKQWAANGGKASNTPLFFYMSYQNAHKPLEPDETMDYSEVQHILNKITDSNRKSNAKLIFNLDYEVNRMLTAFEEVGILDDNYMIVFASDNGPCYEDGGSQYPLRGSKKYTYEGGAKTRSFINSPLLPNASKHESYEGLFHVTDWIPTFMEAVSPGWTDTDEAAELDGISHWKYLLSGASDDFPRSEFIYNIQEENFGTESAYFYGSIRVDNWKLVHHEYCMTWWDYYGRYDDDSYTSQCNSGFKCTVTKQPMSYLFSLDSDPYETTDLKDVYTAEYKRLKNKFSKYAKSLQQPISDEGISSLANIVEHYNRVGCVHPWLN